MFLMVNSLCPGSVLLLRGTIFSLFLSICCSLFGEESETLQAQKASFGFTLAVQTNGDLLISTSKSEAVIQVWDLESGKLLREIALDHVPDYPIAIAPKSPWIAFQGPSDGSGESAIAIQDIQTGGLVGSWRAHTNRLTCLVFSADEKLLATGSFGAEIRIWSLENRTCLKTLVGHNFRPWTLKFSHDGNALYSAGYDNTILRWDLAKGEIAARFQGHEDSVAAFDVDEADRFLVSVGIDQTLRVWDATSGEPVKSVAFNYGRHIRFAPGGGEFWVSSPNDAAVFKTGSWSQIWSSQRNGIAETERSLYPPNLTPMSLRFWLAGPIALTRTGQILMKDHYLKRWHFFESTNRVLSMPFGVDSLYSLCPVPRGVDPSRILIHAKSSEITFFDLDRLEVIRQPIRGAVRNVDFDRFFYLPGREQLIGYTRFSTAQLVDLKKSTFTAILSNSTVSSFGQILMSDDGKKAILPSGSLQSKGRVFDFDPDDAGSGLRVVDFRNQRSSNSSSSGNASTFMAKEGGSFYSLSDRSVVNVRESVFLKQSHRIVSTFVDGPGKGGIRIWDTDGGMPSLTLSLSPKTPGALGASPNGESVAVSVEKKEDEPLILVLNVPDLSLRQTLPSEGRVSCLAFSEDSRRLFAGYADGRIRIWNLDGKEIGPLKPHRDPVTSLCFVPGRPQLLVTSSSNGDLRVHHLPDGRSFDLLVSGTDWLVYSDDGLFDGSKSGGSLAQLRSRGELFDLTQLALRNNRPDLILERMELGSPEIIAHFRAQSEYRIRKSQLQGGADGIGSVRLPRSKIKLLDKTETHASITCELFGETPIGRYNVFVNEVPLFGALGKSISPGPQHALTLSIPLIPGTNKIEVSCRGEDGAESRRAMLKVVRNATAERKLFFVGFGVSRYDLPALTLKYAAKDAVDLGKLFSAMKGNVFSDVRTELYLDRDVGREALQKAKTFLSQSSAEDTVVLFFAGHGVHDRDKNATYYFLTGASSLSTLGETAIRFEEVEDLLYDVAPRSKLLLLDTCESGELGDPEYLAAITELPRTGMIPRSIRGMSVTADPGRRRVLQSVQMGKDRFLYNDLFRRSGTIVFSSSRGDELSYEDDRIQNGFFTHGIISAFKDPASDEDGDGQISVDELRKRVISEVPKATQDLQHPTVDRDNLFQKFYFPSPR